MSRFASLTRPTGRPGMIQYHAAGLVIRLTRPFTHAFARRDAGLDQHAMRTLLPSNEIGRGVRGQRLSFGVWLTVADVAVSDVTASLDGDRSCIRLQKIWHTHLTKWENWVSPIISPLAQGPALRPHLLVRNDAMIAVDPVIRSNAVGGVTGPRYSDDTGYVNATHGDRVILDADELQAFSVSTFGQQHLVIDIDIEPNTGAGRFTRTLSIYVGGDEVIAIPISFVVLPFQWTASPDHLASVYFTQQLSPSLTNDTTLINARTAVSEDYLREMFLECARAGVNPIVYQSYSATAGSARDAWLSYMSLRRDCGLTDPRLFVYGTIRTDLFNPATQAAEYGSAVANYIADASEFGYVDCFFYGTDEVTSALNSDAPLFQACRSAGGKNFVTVEQGVFDQVAHPELLDLIVMHGYAASASRVAQWKSNGVRVAKYASPQGGVGSPALMRRQMGFGAWALGCDGPMNWGWCYPYQDPWDDTDDDIYNDEVMIYMTNGGAIVPTLQWRGYCDAIDDLRYVRTLEARISDSPAGPVRDSASAFLADLSAEMRGVYNFPTGGVLNGRLLATDLDAVRSRIIDFILQMGG